MNTFTRLGTLLAARGCRVFFALLAGAVQAECKSDLPGSRSLRAHARRPGMLLSFLSAHLLASCNSGGDNSSAVPLPDPPPPPPVAATIKHGHYRGLAAIDGQSYHAEAVLTVDGEFRLFVGGAVYGNSGPVTGAGLTGTLLNPEESMQFSGRLALAGIDGSGAGLVTGEACATPSDGRFCGESVFAEVRLNGLADGHLTKLAGEIRTATSAGDEIWLLDLSAWSLYYRSPAIPENIGSPYSERLALFAKGDEIIISFDGAGRMFFQGPATGCTGNGVLTPHLDGESFVFDVDLIIENCNAAYDILNSRFTGLATQTQNGYWSYDTWLVVFLATPDEVESPVALTMYAQALPGWDY